VGSGHVLGEAAGVESITLAASEIPAHTHALSASANIATETDPAGNVPAQAGGFDFYQSDTSPAGAMAPGSIGTSGGSQPHDNMHPYLCVSFIIALEGIFPSQF
jgi:microcystin-dependent protein